MVTVKRSLDGSSARLIRMTVAAALIEFSAISRICRERSSIYLFIVSETALTGHSNSGEDIYLANLHFHAFLLHIGFKSRC